MATLEQNGTHQVSIEDSEAVHASVSKYYGETLKTTSDLKTSACCTAKAPPKEVLDVLRKVPEEVRSKYYGCGSPFPTGMSGQPLRVLDLGCGSGRDCYVCAALVGRDGHVTGVDMTPAQLDVAKAHMQQWTQELGYEAPNMTFLQGTIEDLESAGVGSGSMDLVISNCVINLSPDKAACLQQVARVLVEGGEMYFSDVYCDRRLPAAVRAHEVLLGECLGGALYVNDFITLAKQAGFTDPRVLEVEEILVHDTQLKELLGEARFFSITFRCFKLPGLDAHWEDYGQTATYLGTMTSAPESYTLDAAYSFPAHTPVPVDANTAAFLSSTWLAKHFKVSGAKDEGGHKGMSKVMGGGAVTVADVVDLAAKAPAAGGGGSCCAPAPAAASKASVSCCGPAAGTGAAPGARGKAGGGCCGPAATAPATTTKTSSCCGPTATTAETAKAPADAAVKTGGGCCGAASGGAVAAKGKDTSCCGPTGTTTTGTGATSGCCGPAAAAAAPAGKGSSCCGPASGGAAAAGVNKPLTCCGPPAAAAATGGCCAPASAPAPAAAAPASKGSGGCCGSAGASSKGGGCC